MGLTYDQSMPHTHRPHYFTHQFWDRSNYCSTLTFKWVRTPLHKQFSLLHTIGYADAFDRTFFFFFCWSSSTCAKPLDPAKAAGSSSNTGDLSLFIISQKRKGYIFLTSLLSWLWCAYTSNMKHDAHFTTGRCVPCGTLVLVWSSSWAVISQKLPLLLLLMFWLTFALNH